MQTNDKSSPSSNQVIQEEPSNEIVGKVTKAMWCYSHAYHINNSVNPLTSDLIITPPTILPSSHSLCGTLWMSLALVSDSLSVQLLP